MKAKLIEHVSSVVMIGVLLACVLWWYHSIQVRGRTVRHAALAPYLVMDSVDLSSARDRELFLETAEVYFPEHPGRGDSLLSAIDAYRVERFTREEYKSGAAKGLTAEELGRLGHMAVQFLLVYAVALGLTITVGRSLAVYWFVRAKQGKDALFARTIAFYTTPALTEPPGPTWERLVCMFGSFLASCVLFSPAYVVAYALKGTLDTSSVVFLIGLAVVTNGSLVGYSTRFLLALHAENRQGYVDTARVKNLDTFWDWDVPGGIPREVLWRPASAARSHIFNQIYRRAAFSQFPSLKEHGSFLVTGLIIIEMALNIQGHLGYDLLQHMLYRHYDIAGTIMFGMFLLVKATEVAVDLRMTVLERRYANA